MKNQHVISGKKEATLGLLVLLGAFTAFDSIAIDIYLPAFNVIESDLNLRAGLMPVSLSVFLIGLALGQAISGPIADGLGRRIPLLAGVVLFGAASCLVAVSTNATMLMTGRLLQGIGGATGLVIPRAIVSDLYEANQATRIYTFLIQVQSISPILAPIIGGVILSLIGWRAIFWVLVAFALAAWGFACFFIPETQPIQMRSRLTPAGVFKDYWEIIKNRRYLGMALSSGLIMGTLFTYISGSSFIFMTHFGMSPTVYSIMFAAYSVGMILVGQWNMYLCSRMSVRKNLRFGFTVHLGCLGVLLAALLLGVENAVVVCGLLFCAISSLSFLFGGLTSEAIYCVSAQRAGTASALLGVVQYVIGGGAGILLGLIPNGTLFPLVLLLCACSALALMFWRSASSLASFRIVNTTVSVATEEDRQSVS
ncbi:multidrug effflux MFS transporter [Ereboglobus luteus]|nr:multidrug effflux MFS transporter [Ereboglobus luteus]